MAKTKQFVVGVGNVQKVVGFPGFMCNLPKCNFACKFWVNTCSMISDSPMDIPPVVIIILHFKDASRNVCVKDSASSSRASAYVGNLPLPAPPELGWSCAWTSGERLELNPDDDEELG